MPETNKNLYEDMTADPNFKVCEPRAEAMVYSLRAFGYDLGMAIADLIDNSIFAGAKNIWIDYGWDKGNPWIRILDDGSGMDERKLVEAMRLGTMGPLEKRAADDLGRFGLGLKTASFSQCQLMSVLTKTEDGKVASRFWDLMKVRDSKKWLLGTRPAERGLDLLKPLNKLKKGTAVLWENLDRHLDSGKTDYDPETEFLKKFSTSVKEYLEMVFHQYLESGELKIKVGVAACKPWDPYLKTNSFCSRLYEEEYEDKRVRVIPYVLPHISKRTDQEKLTGGGPKGWNAQQGFYVYRNRRLIVSGGYLNFDFKLDEHCKLGRIRIDITNDMDSEWSLDVRKAIAIPPDRLREELNRIAKVTRQQAEKVYRARLGAPRGHTTGNSNEVWKRIKTGDKIIYKINRDNPVIAKCLKDINPTKTLTNKLFHTIESTVPHRGIVIDNSNQEDCLVDIPENLNPPPVELVNEAVERYKEQRKEGRAHDVAVDIVCSIEPFNTHIRYRTTLDALEEGRKK